MAAIYLPSSFLRPVELAGFPIRAFSPWAQKDDSLAPDRVGGKMLHQTIPKLRASYSVVW
jgi:hypothetical protein